MKHGSMRSPLCWIASWVGANPSSACSILISVAEIPRSSRASAAIVVRYGTRLARSDYSKVVLPSDGLRLQTLLPPRSARLQTHRYIEAARGESHGLLENNCDIALC